MGQKITAKRCDYVRGSESSCGKALTKTVIRSYFIPNPFFSHLSPDKQILQEGLIEHRDQRQDIMTAERAAYPKQNAAKRQQGDGQHKGFTQTLEKFPK
ncbi:hypothetical protein VH86_04160 [Pantoea sp. BL1]|nr:hypothetical protein VH86_04160 [Pantoea sp. BL1]